MCGAVVDERRWGGKGKAERRNGAHLFSVFNVLAVCAGEN